MPGLWTIRFLYQLFDGAATIVRSKRERPEHPNVWRCSVEALLETFARHPRQVLSRDQLLDQVWGYNFQAETNVADVFVGYVRRKLEAGGEDRILHTVRGVGWSLRP